MLNDNLNITDYFIRKSKGLLEIIPEPLNYGNNYSAFNDISPEIEVNELLYAMVRIIKPQNIFETGTGIGVSSAYLAQGLKENGIGKLTTIEYNKERIKQAEDLWMKLELNQWVDVQSGLSLNFDLKDIMFELAFYDSEPEYRFKELEKFYPNLVYGGYAFIHDLGRDMSQNTHNPDHPEVDPWPFGSLPKFLRDKIVDGELIKFAFPSPRGLYGFYKTHLSDHKVL